MNTNLTQIKSYALIAAAASCWGLIGLANRALGAAGFSQAMIVFTRTGIACIAMAIILAITDRSAFRFKLKDIWCFLGSGIISLTIFNYAYTTSMQYMSLSAAAVLLYLAPVFVVLLSAPLFRERITLAKVIALVMILLGACLTTGLVGNAVDIAPIGLAYGVVAGLGYALYSIFSRFAFQRGYSSSTITLYTFFFSTMGASVLNNPESFAAVSFTPDVIGWCLFLSLACCLAPYLMYTAGLRNVENGRASVVASLELVVATIVGVVAFNESFGLMNLLGVALVILGIAASSLSPATSRKKQ